MKIAMIILAGSAALTIISSAAFAQEELTGTVTQVNRINRTVAISETDAKRYHRSEYRRRSRRVQNTKRLVVRRLACWR